MTWQRALEDELTRAFIFREYAPNHRMVGTFEQDAINEYDTNGHFRARVQHVVSFVMGCVDKHVPRDRPCGATIEAPSADGSRVETSRCVLAANHNGPHSFRPIF